MSIDQVQLARKVTFLCKNDVTGWLAKWTIDALFIFYLIFEATEVDLVEAGGKYDVLGFGVVGVIQKVV